MSSRITRALAGAGFLAAVAIGAPGAALAQAGEFVDGKLQPLGSGFPDRALTVMVVDEPGSSDSVYTTQLVEVAEKMSPVPINIEHRQDFSNFGTWEALAWVRDQGDLGNRGYISFVYTIPGAIIDLLVIDMKKEVGVDLDDLNIVVSSEQVPYFLHQRADAPWGDTIQDLVSHAKANPGTVRYISGGAGGGQDAAMQWYMRQLGFTVKEIIGGGSGERALTVAAGAGDVTVSPPDVIMPHFEGGKVEVLMAGGANPSPAPWQAVPNADSLGLKNDPFGQTRGLAVSPEVPEANRAWLEKLFTAAANDPGFIARRQQIPGLTHIILDKEKTLAVGRNSYDFSLPIMKELGVFWGDK